MFIEPIRRRATRVEVITSRAARKLTAKFSVRIADWNTQVAHLMALSLAGRDGPVVHARAGQLLPLILAAQVELERDLEGAPDDVRHSSFVEDPHRALQCLADLLEGMLSGQDQSTRTASRSQRRRMSDATPSSNTPAPTYLSAAPEQGR